MRRKTQDIDLAQRRLVLPVVFAVRGGRAGKRDMNWKAAAKYFWSQFRLWVGAYNEIADRYMIDESVSGGPGSWTVIEMTVKR